MNCTEIPKGGKKGSQCKSPLTHPQIRWSGTLRLHTAVPRWLSPSSEDGLAKSSPQSPSPSVNVLRGNNQSGERESSDEQISRILVFPDLAQRLYAGTKAFLFPLRDGAQHAHRLGRLFGNRGSFCCFCNVRCSSHEHFVFMKRAVCSGFGERDSNKEGMKECIVYYIHTSSP